MKQNIQNLICAVTLLVGAESTNAHSPSFSEGLAPAQDVSNGKWGYLNNKGEWAIPATADRTSEFNCGRAIIKVSDKTQVIDTSGKVVFTCEWAVPGYGGHRYYCNLLRLIKDGKHGFLDLDGRIAIEAKYDDAGDFSEDMAAVCKDGKWGFIGTNGKEVIPFEWSQAEKFSEGLAAVYQGQKVGFIDKTGELIIPQKYSGATSFRHGIALAYNKEDEQWNIINTKGEVIAVTKWNWEAYPEVIGEDRITFRIAVENSATGLHGLSDSKGNVLVEPTWARVGTATGLDSGLAVAVLPGENGQAWGKAGYIDRDGKVVIPYKFDYTNWFKDGMAFATEGDMSGYIDTSGKFVFTIKK